MQCLSSITGTYEESSEPDGKTKELLERTGMKPLSEEVKSCRWKILVFLGKKSELSYNDSLIYYLSLIDLSILI